MSIYEINKGLMNIDNFYKEQVCGDIYNQKPELNKRTGIKTKALPGITFRTDLQKDGFPLLSLRKISFSFIPEIMWFLSGSHNTEWLSKHTKIWDFFTDDNGNINSAYGYRWRYHFGFDQLETILNKLQNDSRSEEHTSELQSH